jgi:hypothetical protein
MAWFGGSAMFSAGLVSLLHSASASLSALVIVGGWGAVSLGLALALRVTRSSSLIRFALFWLLLAVCAAGTLLWNRYV